MNSLPNPLPYPRPPHGAEPRDRRPPESLPACRLLPVLVLSLLPIAMPTSAREPAPKAGTDAEEGSKETVSIELGAWLVTGPVALPMPALADSEYGLAELLAEPTGAISESAAPAAGRSTSALGSFRASTSELSWRRGDAQDGRLRLEHAGEQTADAYRARLAVYLHAERFTEVSLSAGGGGAARFSIGGEEVAKRDAGVEGPTEASFELPPGKHLLVAELASEEPAWEVEIGLTLAPTFAGAVQATLDPGRGVGLGDLLDATVARQLDLSPDGRFLAVTYQRPAVPAEHQERWIEVVDADSGKVLRTLGGGEGNLTWAPSGGRYAYSVADAGSEDTHRILLADLADGERRTLARGIENLEGLRFLPDGSSLIVQVGEPEEEDERGVKRYRQLTDRWSSWRDASHHYALDLEGNMRRLTVGGSEHLLEDLSPGGDRMLISRKQQGLTERPYSRTELVEIELETLAERSVLELGWFDAARYSPDGTHLLVRGSAALFGDAGNPLPAGTIANDYDSQVYLVELASGEARPLSRDFAPSILTAEWSAHDGHIYLRAQDRERAKLFRLDPQDLVYTELPSGIDMVSRFSLARSAPRVAFVGEGVNRPVAVYARGLDPAESPVLLAEPAKPDFAEVEYGRVEPWSFTAEDGTEIDGRVYYPFDFDPARNPTAFPSPRTWEFAHRAMCKFEGGLLQGALQACVGEAAAVELTAFLRHLEEMPDVDEIYVPIGGGGL
ncbi:MAG: hypothetical protein MI919_20520, partial [Holophagales bacterium]|nr:hypothetical protein [Holophagales bacterium]